MRFLIPMVGTFSALLKIGRSRTVQLKRKTNTDADADVERNRLKKFFSDEIGRKKVKIKVGTNLDNDEAILGPDSKFFQPTVSVKSHLRNIVFLRLSASSACQDLEATDDKSAPIAPFTAPMG